MRKKCYDYIMENMLKINEKIASNLAYYRKAAGLTQAELAQKINYSDKSVSKWESGGGVPDVYILMQLADLYGVSLDTLVGKQPQQATVPQQVKKREKGMQILIMLLSSCLVWLVATVCFVVMSIGDVGTVAWLCFLYATVVNAVVLLVYSSVWKYRVMHAICVSALIWTTILSVYVTLRYVFAYYQIDRALWPIFLLGIPLQVLEVHWAVFRSLFGKNGRAKIKEKSNLENLKDEGTQESK